MKTTRGRTATAHSCLELAAYLLTSEVCSQFVKTPNLKLIVLLDHIFIYEVSNMQGPWNFYVKLTGQNFLNIFDDG